MHVPDLYLNDNFSSIFGLMSLEDNDDRYVPSPWLQEVIKSVTNSTVSSTSSSSIFSDDMTESAEFNMCLIDDYNYDLPKLLSNHQNTTLVYGSLSNIWPCIHLGWPMTWSGQTVLWTSAVIWTGTLPWSMDGACLEHCTILSPFVTIIQKQGSSFLISKYNFIETSNEMFQIDEENGVTSILSLMQPKQKLCLFNLQKNDEHRVFILIWYWRWKDRFTLVSQLYNRCIGDKINWFYQLPIGLSIVNYHFILTYNVAIAS